MKAIQIQDHGGLQALQTVELPPPVAGPGQVTVRVTHVGLNHLDVWVRRGVDGHRFPLPLVPGSDVVGIRTDTGERVALQPATSCGQCTTCLRGSQDLCSRFSIRGESMDGGLCEEVVVHERELLPCSLPPEKAAALPLSLLTAWHMLVGRAQVKAGDRVLVQAGASGVGSLAIQIAKLCGAQVAATASTPEKRARCLEIGADACWTYDEAVSHAKTWTQKSGVDVVLDHVGTATWESSLRMLRRGGTYVTCGATTGHLATLNLRLLFFKQLNIMGSTMGSMAEMHQAWDLASMGAIEPVVDRVLPVRELGLAHQLLEDRNVTGKIVIALGDPTDW